MKNIELAKKYEDYIISMRRYFHENPELSDFEFGTIERLCQELEDMGIDYTVVENGGILAFIEGKKQGRTVLLRADIDALPVQETLDNLKEGARTCISKNDGVMHACGHDGHMAMLLGAAKILMDKKDQLEGRVILCFERAEEGGTLGSKYLFKYIEDNDIRIDTVYATHLLATAPAGYIAINDGGMMAGVMPFNITIEGRGGHGSRPDQSVNPIDAFRVIYTGMQSLRLTKVDPYKALAYSVGSLHAGAVSNVIPQTVTFAGTMRTYDTEGEGVKFHDALKNLVDNTCAAYNCTPIYNKFTKPGYATVNDEDMAKWARKVLSQEMGEDRVGTWEPWMASESYAMYLRQWSGVFAFLGVENPEKGVGAPHHNQAFDIDEDVLKYGAAAAATYAIEYLKDDTLKGGRLRSFKEVYTNNPSTTKEDIARLYVE